MNKGMPEGFLNLIFKEILEFEEGWLKVCISIPKAEKVKAGKNFNISF